MKRLICIVLILFVEISALKSSANAIGDHFQSQKTHYEAFIYNADSLQLMKMIADEDFDVAQTWIYEYSNNFGAGRFFIVIFAVHGNERTEVYRLNYSTIEIPPYVPCGECIAA